MDSLRAAFESREAFAGRSRLLCDLAKRRIAGELIRELCPSMVTILLGLPTSYGGELSL